MKFFKYLALIGLIIYGQSVFAMKAPNIADLASLKDKAKEERINQIAAYYTSLPQGRTKDDYLGDIGDYIDTLSGRIKDDFLSDWGDALDAAGAGGGKGGGSSVAGKLKESLFKDIITGLGPTVDAIKTTIGKPEESNLIENDPVPDLPGAYQATGKKSEIQIINMKRLKDVTGYTANETANAPSAFDTDSTLAALKIAVNSAQNAIKENRLKPASEEIIYALEAAYCAAAGFETRGQSIQPVIDALKPIVTLPKEAVADDILALAVLAPIRKK